MIKKINFPFVIIEAVIMVAFSIIAFAVCDQANYSTGGFIASYIFLWVFALANVVAMYVFNKVNDRRGAVQDYMYIVPAAGVCLGLSLIFSIIFLACKPDRALWAVILNIILLVFYIGYLVIILYFIKGISEQRAKTRKKVNFIRFLTADIDSALAVAEDPVNKEELTKLRDDIRFSDPMSADELKEVELKLMELADELKKYVEEKKTDSTSECVRQMSNLLAERNRKCKILK